METNNFKKLYNIDVREKTKRKNNLNYLSWAAAWAEVKKVFPEATYKIYENEIGRPWFDDGRTGWVKTGVTIDGIEHIEMLAVMDFKNKSMPADEITSVDANKSIQRCLTKACARHGLGLYIYEGEDLPEDAKRQKKQKDEEKVKQDRELSEIHKEMVAIVKEKLESGIKREIVIQLLEKNGGNPNPNAIKDIDLCKLKLEELKDLEKAGK